MLQSISSAKKRANQRIHPTGFASLRSARLRVMRVPLASATQHYGMFIKAMHAIV